MRPPTRASVPTAPGPDDARGARPGARPVGDDELRRLLACLPGQALVLLDRDGTVLTWNPGAEALTGHAPGEVVGAGVEVLYPREAVAVGRPRQDLERAAALGRLDEEDWRLRADGSRFWAHVVTTALVDADGEVGSYGMSVADLTARREAEQQTEAAVDLLSTTVRTDVATGFLNRRGWEEALRREVGLAERRGLSVCVAVLDLDLDVVERRAGETATEAATRALRVAGRAWRTRLRTTDVLARIDERSFAVLLVDCQVDTAMGIVERMRGATPPGLACSAGLAAWDEHEAIAALVERAEDAVRRARDGGPARTVRAPVDGGITRALERGDRAGATRL